jgi:hypothetical protein
MEFSARNLDVGAEIGTRAELRWPCRGWDGEDKAAILVIALTRNAC